MMKFVLILTLLFVMLPVGYAVEVRGWCDGAFYGTSTLHDFSGTVRSRPFTASFAEKQYGIEDLEGVPMRVRVRDMDTGNRRMNENMYKMFEVKKYPVITGTVAESRARETASSGDTPRRVTFAITIQDRTKHIDAAIKDVRRRGGRVETDVEFNVSLNAFGLKPPTFFGIFRVHDKVRVTMTIVLTEAA
ncbi:MAG: YceI family protein [Candidatus Pacebacteria bacterium]|nr:YceI family protein [Candidatus Paceibacterota bacterium]